MKKILIFNYGYYPAQKYGGPVNSVANFCSLLKNEFECFVVTCDHEIDSSERLLGIEDSWNVVGDCKVLYLPDNRLKYTFIKNVIKEINPDAVYLQSVFEARFFIPALHIAKKMGIKTVVAPRGDICDGAMLKKKLIKKMYLFCVRTLGLTKKLVVHSTSNEEATNANRYLKVPLKNIICLENIPSMNIDTQNRSSKKEGELKIVFIGRIVPKKNVLKAIQLAVRLGKSVIFDIYGTIEDNAYWQKCCDSIPEDMKSSIKYMGELKHEQVYNTFCKYDVFLFPTFSENYGHTIVEAMQSGCPVVISDKTPWRNLTTVSAGWDISLENDDEFIRVLTELKNMDEIKMSQYRIATKKYINSHVDFDELKNKYAKMFLEEVIIG